MGDIENKKIEDNESAFVSDSPLTGKKIVPTKKPDIEIGVDLNNTLVNNLIDAGIKDSIDMSQLEAFTSISQNRETLYQLLDTMSEDSTVSAMLEVYAEDVTETNDHGDIMWVESEDSETAKYVGFILDSMKVNKNIYKWAYALCKYGDIYLRLYHESEYEKDDLFSDEGLDDDRKKNRLDEDVKVKLRKKSDHYTNYISMHPNPAEIFELTRFGKTYGYIQADTISYNKNKDYVSGTTLPFYKYSFNKRDVTLYPACDFVHATLEDNSPRNPEEVSIFRTEDDDNPYTYEVKRGQSILYPMFKVWREMMLLENSVLLNRITKSSITRVISVQIGDMPEPQVSPYMQKLKSLIEQKSSLDTGVSMGEYTNPGPIENNIYMPVRGEQGVISTSQIGGDVDVKSLADIEYFADKFYSAGKVPKQFLGKTDDSTGFNGGTSLTLISSRYAKTIKRIQNVLIQAITDAVNIILLDRGFDRMVNNYTIMMQKPTTQEEIDRRDNLVNKVGVVRDIMDIISNEVQDEQTRLKMLKSMLSDVITNPYIIELLQEEIEKMEEEALNNMGGEEDLGGDDFDDDDNRPLGLGGSSPRRAEPSVDMDIEDNNFDMPEPPMGGEGGGESLPTPDEIGIDMTDMSGE